MTTCAICDVPEEEFDRNSIIVGELVIYDVNESLDDVGHGPVCSRDCLFKVPDDVYPFTGYQIADRFKPHYQREGYDPR
ncbi:hypothetical protein [Halocatena halophila]|uniref:hypothetical protein n=1 Tax=Halocatena halophila TaxID=2814576 RepID=UPI002ED04158